MKNIGKFPERFYQLKDYSAFGAIMPEHTKEFHQNMLDEIREVMKKYGCIEITVDQHGDLQFEYYSYSQDEEQYAWFYQNESNITVGE